ncbi:hypothetical protein PanWU01x14_202360, partial [Parasponia andersonii]
MEVESGRVGGDQDRSATFLDVLAHGRRNQISDRRFRRYQHLYGSDAPLDRHVEKKLRQLDRPSFGRRRRCRYDQTPTRKQVGDRLRPPELRGLLRQAPAVKRRRFLRQLSSPVLLLLPSP